MRLPHTFRIGESGEVAIEWISESLEVTYTGLGADAIYLALDDGDGMGSPIVPHEREWEGSTVFLPFPAKSLFYVVDGVVYHRHWRDYSWSAREITSRASYSSGPEKTIGGLSFAVGDVQRLELVIYVKSLRENSGWGTLLGSTDGSAATGPGDRVIGSFLRFTRDATGNTICERVRRSRSSSRIRIYELFPRLFGNTKTIGKQNGRLAENGCGKFADINEPALSSLAKMNFTHIWLLGVVRHASTTGYPELEFAPDDSDLMKGLAGSPFAVKDCFDVNPDLATDPENRAVEFRSLLDRIHAQGLKAIIDLVPNHVSRAYMSSIRPDLHFGAGDETSEFFTPSNNFYYLRTTDEGGGPPLRLPTFDRSAQQPISPTCVVQGDCDGLFEGEQSFGRVTGNNRLTWTPDITDWYETVKLNYGYDFREHSSACAHFPGALAPWKAIPDTWWKVDAVIAHWQAQGVDGFRCDMAHMVPPEFWAWAISRARERDAQVFFMAEAYNDSLVVPPQSPDLLALGQGSPSTALLHAGFDAVYGHDAYSVMRQIYMGPKWANDIDATLGSEFVAANSVRYSENHDEVRLASPLAWGGLGHNVGRPVSAVLYGLPGGPILFYNGQEVGEPAAGASGFSGDDGRTTIFDYWFMPELSKWVNNCQYDGGELSSEQAELRHYYSRLLALSAEPAFSDGQFLPLNPFNLDNPRFGRCDGETVSGHWLYAFLRYDLCSGQRFLAVANFHGRYFLEDVRIRMPRSAWDFLDLANEGLMRLQQRLGAPRELEFDSGSEDIHLGSLPPLTAYYFSIEAGSFS